MQANNKDISKLNLQDHGGNTRPGEHEKPQLQYLKGLDPALYSWKDCKSILVVRTDHVGDLIMSTPAIRLLKTFTEAKITVLTSPTAQQSLPLIKEIDAALVADLPWMNTTTCWDKSQMDDLRSKLAAAHFDGCIIFTVYSQTALPAAALAWEAGIPRRLAYARENPYQLLTHWVPDPEPYHHICHQVVRDLELVLAIRDNGPHPLQYDGSNEPVGQTNQQNELPDIKKTSANPRFPDQLNNTCASAAEKTGHQEKLNELINDHPIILQVPEAAKISLFKKFQQFLAEQEGEYKLQSTSAARMDNINRDYFAEADAYVDRVSDQSSYAEHPGNGAASAILNSPYIIIHTGASEIRRQYPVGEWIKLCRAIHTHYKIPIILTGTKKDGEVNRVIKEATETVEGGLSAGIAESQSFCPPSNLNATEDGSSSIPGAAASLRLLQTLNAQHRERVPEQKVEAASQSDNSTVPTGQQPNKDLWPETTLRTKTRSFGSATSQIFDLSGLLTLSEFAAIISQARLVISVNTGAVHIASGFRKPVITLYARTNPQHTAWLPQTLSRIFEYDIVQGAKSLNQIVAYVDQMLYRQQVGVPGTDKLMAAVRQMLMTEQLQQVTNTSCEEGQ